MAVIAIAGMVMVSACTTTATPTVTPSVTPSATPSATPISIASFNQSDNNKTVSVKSGDIFQVTLEENPSTGYMWNASVTSGLNVINTTYLPSNTTLAGAPGLRQWNVEATDMGNQTFSAVYTRSNAPATGNQTTYVLNVNVSAPMLGMLP